MSRPRLPYLQRDYDRHGNARWYVRKDRGKRIRIKGEYGSPEFKAAYEVAVYGKNAKAKPKVLTQKDTLRWLIQEYRKSTDWLNSSTWTKKQKDYIFVQVLDKAGDRPYKDITRKVIMASRDERASKPCAAANFLTAMNGLFKWAVDAEHVEANPCLGIKAPKRKNKDGFAAWTEEDVAKYQASWPVGTKERVWLDVLLYTGLRKGDAVRIGRQHIRDGVAYLKTEKSGYRIEVALPVLPVLQKTLDSSPTSDLAFICGANGQPLTKESFGNAFREACNKAGVNKSAHGVRKISATRAANAGATVAQLKALFGWTDNDMPSLYTQTADRRKLARDAIEKLTINSEY